MAYVAYYFGAKYSSLYSKTRGYADFLKKSAEGIWNEKHADLKTTAQQISNNLGGNKDLLLKSEKLKRIVLVLVVNWWKTYGEVKIWQKKNKRILSKQELNKKMKKYFPLISDKNYAGLEAVFGDNTNWFTVQSSDKSGSNYIFNADKTIDFLQKIFNFKEE